MKANKKILSVLLAVSLLLALVPTASASGEDIELSLSKQNVFAGDSLTVTVYVSGSEVYGFQFNLKYDTEVLSLSSEDTGLLDKWGITSGNVSNGVATDEETGTVAFAGYSTAMTPIQEKTAVCTVTFDISDDFAVGAKTEISVSDVVLSVGMPTSALNIDGAAVNAASVKKPSTDTTLSSLTLTDQNGNEVEYAPAFRSTRTEYNLTVPFEITKLDVQAVASDENAKFTVNSPNLTVGRTAYVTVKVTAESGATRTYTVSVTRQENPDREKGTDATLSSLSVEGYVLSPPFSPDITEYIIWLPYETFEVVISAKTTDAKAVGFRVEGNNALHEGKDNKITVTVTAEDSTVKKIYTITAKRAAAQGEETAPPPVTDTETDKATEPVGNISVGDGNGAEVIIPDGAVTEGADVTITSVTATDELTATESLLGAAPLCLYRVYIATSGVAIQPDKPLLIQLPIPEGASDAFNVVFIPSSDSKNRNIPFTSKGGLISFTSAEAGLFAVVPLSPAATTVETEQTTQPKETKPAVEESTDTSAEMTFTGMIKRYYLPLIIAIAVALLLGFLIGLLIFKRKRNPDDEPPQEPDDDEPFFDSDGLERTIVIPDLPEINTNDKEHIRTVGDISTDDSKKKR